MQEEKSANTDLMDRETAVTKLAIAKVEGMAIGNHKTAYNALHNLSEPHRTNLRRMGYGILFYILRFEAQNDPKTPTYRLLSEPPASLTTTEPREIFQSPMRSGQRSGSTRTCEHST